MCHMQQLQIVCPRRVPAISLTRLPRKSHFGVAKTATYTGVQSGLYDTCSKHSKPSKSIGSSTISINTNTDRCYVAFSVKWQSRLWRIVDVEFTVTETLMSFNDKSSRTFRRITFHKRQHVYWCDFRCSTLFNNVTLLRP